MVGNRNHGFLFQEHALVIKNYALVRDAYKAGAAALAIKDCMQRLTLNDIGNYPFVLPLVVELHFGCGRGWGGG